MTWVSTSALSGEIIADLPDLVVPSVKRSLGVYETATATLELPSAPENWVDATLEGGVNLILLADNPDDAAHGIPIYGAMVTKRNRGDSDQVPISMSTLEAYFDRRYIGDETFTGVGQNVIVQTLIENYVATGPNGGLPIRVQVVTPGDGKPRDKTYADRNDKTVYSALLDLMGIIDGPEFTVGWEWQHSPERITPVLYVGDRIGQAQRPGLGVNATFELPGDATTADHAVDYSSTGGANVVVATSSASGDTRPQSPPQVYRDPARPTFEYRWTPSTSITDVDTLTDHAKSALAQLQGGAASLSLSSLVQLAATLDVDWSLGDDVGYVLGGVGENGRETVPSWPGGIVGVGRAIGFELTLGPTPVLTPVLAGPLGGDLMGGVQPGSVASQRPPGDDSEGRQIAELRQQIRELGPSIADSFKTTIDTQNETIATLATAVDTLTALSVIQYDEWVPVTSPTFTGAGFGTPPASVTITSPTGNLEVQYGGSLNGGDGYFVYSVTGATSGVIVDRADVQANPAQRVAVSGGASFAPSGFHTTILESLPIGEVLTVNLEIWASSTFTYFFGGSILARVAP